MKTSLVKKSIITYLLQTQFSLSVISLQALSVLALHGF